MRLLPRFSVAVLLVAALLATSARSADLPADWAYKRFTRPAVPNPTTAPPALSNPIDRFVVARLEAKGLKLAPEADRRTLIRRVYFDLIGLPPTPEDVEAFVADKSP